MSAASRHWLSRLKRDWPIIQAPMAGVSTPAMAAAASNAGALGSIGVGAARAADAAHMIDDVRRRTDRPFNVNVFCHRPAQPKPDVERAWIERLAPRFAEVGAQPPRTLTEIYTSFLVDDDMLAVFLDRKPPIVSFHFGVPDATRLRALHEAGIVLFGSATTLAEARILADAGIDAIVAQGYEAGGHRGVFDPDAPDDKLGTLALTRILVDALDIPIIAAGGIMDGAGIAAALKLGAVAAQLGTAFIACDESLADAGFRAKLFSDAAHHTTMTRAISGRPARCLPNRFTELGDETSIAQIPDYPIAYDIGKALHAASKAKGEFGFGAQWAGQGAPLARAMSTSKRIATLIADLNGTSS
jgi:nitronate monooxygenase